MADRGMCWSTGTLLVPRRPVELWNIRRYVRRILGKGGRVGAALPTAVIPGNSGIRACGLIQKCYGWLHSPL